MTSLSPATSLFVWLESTEGLLVQRCLLEGYRVCLLNLKAVSEYRNQYRPSRTKSDSLDAKVPMEMIRDYRDRFDPVYPDCGWLGNVVRWPRIIARWTSEKPG